MSDFSEEKSFLPLQIALGARKWGKKRSLGLRRYFTKAPFSAKIPLQDVFSQASTIVFV
jgi:hypothetical protein